MQIETHSFTINTKGNCDILDITGEVEKLINETGFIEGNVLVFAGGSTAGITTIEYEPGLLQDYPAFFNKIVPVNLTTNTIIPGTTATVIHMFVLHYKVLH